MIRKLQNTIVDSGGLAAEVLQPADFAVPAMREDQAAEMRTFTA
jgi:hypothetical protein